LTNYIAASHNLQTPRLIFHRYGGQYFLAQAWMPNSDQGYECFASAREIQLARNGGQDVVELALVQQHGANPTRRHIKPCRRRKNKVLEEATTA
jgi:hypothetical protein